MNDKRCVCVCVREREALLTLTAGQPQAPVFTGKLSRSRLSVALVDSMTRQCHNNSLQSAPAVTSRNGRTRKSALQRWAVTHPNLADFLLNAMPSTERIYLYPDSGRAARLKEPNKCTLGLKLPATGPSSCGKHWKCVTQRSRSTGPGESGRTTNA